jgi:hypothetical protein
MCLEIQMSEELLKERGFWALVGVLAGFIFGEGARYVRYRWRVCAMKKNLKSELRSLKKQIDQKKEIIRAAISVLNKKQLMPTLSVPSITVAYAETFGELLQYYSMLERNCIHNIYERALLSDKVLESFEADFLQAVKQGIYPDPYQVFAGKLDDVHKGLEVAQELIGEFLDGRVSDIYQTGT